MKDFIASARKYRPRSFSEVIGQKNITNTLENALEKDQISHAMLFCGPHGVGKTTCARILAQLINQKNASGDDREQENAFNIFELDAASNNSVDDIRSLNEQIRYPPPYGKHKVYIIDEVHMLSTSAFNAFLKTLEEPPDYVIFILATTERHKVLPTILSRCQIFDFKRIDTLEIRDFLEDLSEKESIVIPTDALHLIASKAQGAIRDALSTFDKVISFSGKEITLENVTEILNILDHNTYLNTSQRLLEGQITKSLLLFDVILKRGFQAELFVSGLGSHFRNLLISKDPEANKLLDAPEDTKKNYTAQSKLWEPSELILAIEICERARVKYASSVNGRLTIELALMQLASIKKGRDNKKKTEFYIAPPEASEESSCSASPKKTSVKTQALPSGNEHTKALEEEREIASPKKESKATMATKPEESLTFSIQEFLSEQAVDQTKTDRSEMPKDAFSESELIKKWNAFVKEQNDKGNFNIHRAFTYSKPELIHKNKIRYEFASLTMERSIEGCKEELLQFLRKALNNYGIEMETYIGENKKDTLPYTPEEKYNYFASKNPLVKKLKENLDLDYDY